MRLAQRMAEVERKLSAMMVPATVAERDHQKGVRLKLSEGDKDPVLSSWIKPPDKNGKVKSSYLPSVGEQVLMFTPPGSDRAIALLPIGHHKNSKNPARDGDDHVLYDDGTCRIAVSKGVVEIKSGKTSLALKDGEIQIKSTELKHNAKNIGDTHKHIDVKSGSSTSGPPEV